MRKQKKSIFEFFIFIRSWILFIIGVIAACAINPLLATVSYAFASPVFFLYF